MAKIFTAIKIFVVIFFIACMAMGIVSGIGAALAAIEAMGGECNFDPILCNWLVAFGFPPQFLNSNTFFWYAIIPLGIIAISIYIVFSFVRNVVPGLNEWAIGAFSILGALATVPTRFFLVFVGTTMVIFGTYAYTIMLLIGVLAGIGVLEKVWSYTKKAFSPKQQYKDIKKIIEEELKAGKEIRDVIQDVDKEIARVKREIQKDWMEYDRARTKEAKVAILAAIYDKQQYVKWLETLASRRLRK